MRFRQKSAQRVIAELRGLVPAHPARGVVMLDDLMPADYFETLIPRLGPELPDLCPCYEHKADPTLAQAHT